MLSRYMRQPLRLMSPVHLSIWCVQASWDDKVLRTIVGSL